MRLVGRIFSIFFLIIASLLALVFAFIEIRSLVAGDFLLMNTPTLSFIGYLFRFFYFLALCTFNISLLINIIQKKPLNFVFLFLIPFVLFSSLFSIFFYSTYVYFLVIFIALVPALVLVGKKFIV